MVCQTSPAIVRVTEVVGNVISAVFTGKVSAKRLSALLLFTTDVASELAHSHWVFRRCGYSCKGKSILESTPPLLNFRVDSIEQQAVCHRSADSVGPLSF